jgi:hypothetical protein
MQIPEPQKEHQWLHKLIGDWTFEGECSMGPDQPPMKNIGKETVRSLGGLWTIGEGEVEMPDGSTMQSIMTLGYNPPLNQFVGSFVAGCMTYFWRYSGTLHAAQRVLTLDTEGPSFANDGSMARYQDIIEFQSDDERTLSSQYLGPDGKWIPFMKAQYQRVK